MIELLVGMAIGFTVGTMLVFYVIGFALLQKVLEK